MSRPLIVAVTGGIGSGKSTVSTKLISRGFKVYNTDNEARRLQNSDMELISRMKELLGSDVFTENSMNRAMVAERVFSQPELLIKLAALVHPVVKEDFHNWVQENSNEKILFMETAVLFEGKFNEMVDKIIVVSADKEIRITRVMQRDSISRVQVEARISNQKNQEELIKLSDYQINTNEGINALDSQISSILNTIL